MIAHVDTAVQSTMQAAHVAGATVAVVKDGSVVYIRGFGLSDSATRRPAAASTAYEVGSITKQFTAAAILQLSERGKVHLDATVATYLPTVPHAKEITVRQLLAMTSGLPNYVAGPNVESVAGTPASFDDLMSRIARKPLDFAPGTAFGASNTNYLVLGRIVEVVSGERWTDYVREHLFAPAGMTESATIAGESQLATMARGYAYSDGKMAPAPRLDDSWATATGDIVTTAGDLAKWDAALASGRIVTPQDYRLMTTAQPFADGSDTGYGFGAYVDTLAGVPRVFAQGDTFGFDASDAYYPKQGVHIIVLTNTEAGAVGSSSSEEIGDAVYDVLFPVSAGSEQAFYAAALRTMDELPQPPLLTYTLHGQSSATHIGLMTSGHQVWLAFQKGSAPTTWEVKHRTQDYKSEVVDGVGGQRYVSQRPLFDPTWFGAVRALRDGMLAYQTGYAPHAALTVAPTPDPNLKTIASVSVIGPGIYAVEDRGLTTCANGDPGRAMHLISRRRDPRHQLSDVVIDLHNMQFCTIRFALNQMWLKAIVEQHYATVDGYWVVTGGSMDGTLKILGIPTHRFTWTYRLDDIAFPNDIPAATFVPDPTQ